MPQIFASERPAQRRAATSSATARIADGKLSALQRKADESPAQLKLAAMQQMAVQRMEDEELLQGKDKPGGLEVPLQRVEGEDEEIMQGKAVSDALAAPVQRQQQSATGGGAGLPAGLRSGIENLSGLDMSDVKVHYNSAQPAQLNAHAYAQGTDIHLGQGQEKHLGHEAWHVVQQKQGRVQPTMDLAGVGVNDDGALEAEADRMGAQASQSQKDEAP